jgi:hypothetical protein
MAEMCLHFQCVLLLGSVKPGQNPFEFHPRATTDHPMPD